MNEPAKKVRNLFDEFQSMYSHKSIETRGENAWMVAVKFFDLLVSQVEDPEVQKKLMSAWVKSLKTKKYHTFRRALRKAMEEEQK